MLEAPMAAVRAKSVQLTEMFDALVTQEIGAGTFALVSPREPEMRGSQLCYAHESGWPIMRALIDRGVIGDFRAPDILRFGFTPLYVSFVDVWNAVATLREILAERAWDDPRYHERALVT
jgi:kynureninase